MQAGNSALAAAKKASPCTGLTETGSFARSQKLPAATVSEAALTGQSIVVSHGWFMQ
jgi:hypothetical protein